MKTDRRRKSGERADSQDVPTHFGSLRHLGRPVPTMTDVARQAGVSAMTVSRALKNDAQVSLPTREKILRAVNELGYVLDQAAGSLSSRKTGFIATLIPSINNSGDAEIKGLGIEKQTFLEHRISHALIGRFSFDMGLPTRYGNHRRWTIGLD